MHLRTAPKYYWRGKPTKIQVWVRLSQPRHQNVKKSQKSLKTPLKTPPFLLVTAPRHSVSFLARFWDLICIELFLIYLYIFLLSLSHENQWFCIVFIAVKFFKKLTFKSQFFSDFQKFRKSMNFSKKIAFFTKFHFDVDLWVFDKKIQFFSSESWDSAFFRFFNIVLTAPIPLARFWYMWNRILTKNWKSAKIRFWRGFVLFTF